MINHEQQPPRLAFGGIGIESASARAYLINIAETIQHSLLPQLQGHAQIKANECLRTALHLAAALQPPTEVQALLTAQSQDEKRRVSDEGQAFEASFAAAEALIESVLQSSAPAGRIADPGRIEDFLRAHPRGGSSLRVLEAKLLPGGRSKQTMLVSVEGARDLPPALVIRQDWAAAVTGTSVPMEFEVLRRLHAAGIRVPEPLIVEPGTAALDAPFLVVSRLAGQVVGNLYDPPPSLQPIYELAEQLGRAHALSVDDFAALPGVVERSYTTAQLRSDLARFRAVIEKHGSPLPRSVCYAMDWLAATVPRVHGPRTLVHGDISFHNILCEGEQLTALLDWEMAHIGNPALDLGWLKTLVERSMPWADFQRRYLRAGGAEVDPFVVDWYGVYTTVWFIHLLMQAREAVTSGALHDIDYTQVAAHYGPAAMAALSKRLKAAQSHG